MYGTISAMVEEAKAIHFYKPVQPNHFDKKLAFKLISIVHRQHNLLRVDLNNQGRQVDDTYSYRQWIEIGKGARNSILTESLAARSSKSSVQKRKDLHEGSGK